MNKYYKLLTIVIAFLILSLVTVASFAYFSASVQGNDNAYDTVITSGEMALMLNDGEQVGLNNAIPGDSVTKEFSVKNTGTVQTTYDVYFSELTNLFEDKNDLVYIVTSDNGCADSTEKIVLSESSDESKMISSCLINPNQTHNYTLTITFKDDGTNQDDNKGKQFKTKIAVNEWKEGLKTVAQTMLSLKTNGSTELEYDETVDNNLRYVGANPNNYVEFNGELWRIIGVMNNIEKEDGTTESLVKIRRTESLGNYSWDTTDSSINIGYGINQWGAIDGYEGADLMRELNTDYLGNITVGTDDKWYNGSNNSKTVNMPTSTLNTSAQSMIQTVKWNLGSPSNNNGTYDSSYTTNIIPSTSYTRERANANGIICTYEPYCNDTANRTNAWTGKVGLIYPSDYGYATSGGTTTNRATCLTTSMSKWYGTEVSDCRNNDWLFQSLWQWTLSPLASSHEAYSVFYVNSSGDVRYTYAGNTIAVFPVVFLQSDITITGGNGSSTSPFTME
ncbi:MAG: hypothetical protein E7159_00470 [Firmicutes bacterium]|nr:hypothetical protein [Bacillota bacterium]